MTDRKPNDLSHLSEEEFNSLCPQGEHAPGPEPLTPAAQAVVNAVDHYETNHWLTPREVAAAALRAVACKAKTLEVFVEPGFFELDEFIAVRDLRTIAAELEGAK